MLEPAELAMIEVVKLLSVLTQEDKIKVLKAVAIFYGIEDQIAPSRY